MSSSDSDYSLDWLASDEEDMESETGLGPDTLRRDTYTSSCASSSCTSSSCTSSSSGVKRCSSPAHATSPDSRSSAPFVRPRRCDRGLKSGSGAGRKEEGEEDVREETQKEDEEGTSCSSVCSSPSSCRRGSPEPEEAQQEHPSLGLGMDMPWHPWGDVTEVCKRRMAHKRTREPEGRCEELLSVTHSHQTDKDRLFASKCLELQCYIQPLSSILNGLRAGRYRQRLSSFQESVAMDRIQRIMGVLQNPLMGERYVTIILKVEEMLKSWFPHVRPLFPPHASKHINAHQPQMQPPSKKQKLSVPVPSAVWPVTMATPSSACVHTALSGSAAGSGSCSKSAALPARDQTPPGVYSSTNLKWLHTSPICSATSDQAQGSSQWPTPLPPHSSSAPAAGAPPSSRESEPTQDNAVSSSTDTATPPGNQDSANNNNHKAGGARGKTDLGPAALAPRLPPPPPGPGRPPPGKISAPCLERLLKATESIITQRGAPPPPTGVAGTGWS